MRVKDSMKDLKKKRFAKKYRRRYEKKFLLKEAEFKIAGVLVIFNNLLQSLFVSQIKSLGFVMFGIFLMFWVLFKSLRISLIGIIQI